MNTKRDILRKSHGFVEKSAIPACLRQVGRRNPQSAIGFTLVELLVIVSIIALLVGMLLPTLNKFRDVSRKAKTRAIISMIDGACQQYFTDFEDYPPSQDNDDYNGWTGSELITLFLTGYGPDKNDDGIPDVANLDTDDGVDGFGFRLEHRGWVYGQYGVEKLDTRINIRPEFVDARLGESGGNPILYYRWTGSRYNASHNTNGPGDGSQAILDEYVRDADGGAYYRTDFILISRGLNGDWDEAGGAENDDVTNFFNR